MKGHKRRKKRRRFVMPLLRRRESGGRRRGRAEGAGVEEGDGGRQMPGQLLLNL